MNNEFFDALLILEKEKGINAESLLEKIKVAIENAVKKAGKAPVIIGIPLEGADGGNQEKWGGTLFDTAASICSPFILPQENSDYIQYIENNYTVMNDKAKNNFSTIKIVPTVKNQTEDIEFYKKLSKSNAESYIIIP